MNTSLKARDASSSYRCQRCKGRNRENELKAPRYLATLGIRLPYCWHSQQFAAATRAAFQQTGWQSKKLADALLDQAGVAALSGTAFGSAGEGYLRFSIANSIEHLQEALDRVDQWTKENL